jgi:endonuclease/exonuclease/phosphatase family metal-dependent hydrolase
MTKTLVALTLAITGMGCAGTPMETDQAAAGTSDLRAADDPPQTAPATRRIRLVHFNISGAVLNRGFNEVVDRVFDEAEARGADLISINEGCRDQVEHLRDRLRDKGHAVTLQFAPTGNNALCVHSFGTNTAQSGPAILAVRGGSNGQNHYWQGADSVDTRTDRGMACLTTNLGRDVRVCSAHLTPADGEAAAQAESMIRRFGASFREAPAIIVGDFNASPDFLKQNAPNLYAPAGSFFEADARENKATHGEGKIDYVFMSKEHFSPDAKMDVKDMGDHDPWWGSRRAWSDHRLCASEIDLKL